MIRPAKGFCASAALLALVLALILTVRADPECLVPVPRLPGIRTVAEWLGLRHRVHGYPDLRL